MARLHIPFTGPVAKNLNRSSCAKLAQMVLETASSDWMSQIVRDLGGKIEVAPMGEHEISLEVFGAGDFRIHTSSSSLRRDNFQTAVALGHYLIHFPKIETDQPGTGMQVPTDVTHPHYPDKQARFEATWFATELTMPEAKLKAVADEVGPDYVAPYFLVPQKYLATRMEKLGLLEQMKVSTAGPAPTP
ncbi:ImmA/IrrE family metallo-endopeptidase [Salipiger mucosus]|uniref:IrrE N-terminal-like domain-containing protein n=1 Tax=Salipiger mucosus DSM 16094 TaxID=1123237 RepID=S9RF67_9RHOB|nr:ImmA/IrrE family metallo-endopeptidase [Salipiger mucosus]EPX76755.1 hypothetical protein Salmuc_04641 [Salipiger mucosus DSM 16094]